ncbi:hypothetical protein V1264_021749 [Littorina saxatilis]|uniref:RRM domain-containing protein n=2 Tax=Littorina saxatilis TaxID=31220 RepID=A0AAN9FW61_9CAEN
MEETFAEHKEWVGGTVNPGVQKVYGKALDTLKKVKPFEAALLAAEAPRLAEYQKYLEFEMSEGDPARIQCLFERALLENCLVPELWIQYTKYLDEKLKIGSMSMAAYERAMRNSPWSGTLWRNYILTLERNSQPFETIKGTMDKALAAGLTDSSDYLLVWTVYCDYLRRRIDWNKDHETELETYRLTVERAADHLFNFFGLEGDPEASLRQFWADIEARHCKNLERARELWNQVMQEGYGSQAAMWLNYYRLERTFGDVKHCRRILQRALNSVTDWLEAVTQAYLDFEREEGTLEDYEQAYSKCEAQLARVNERKAKAADKEAAIQEQKKLQRAATKAHKKGEKTNEKEAQSAAKDANSQKNSGKWSASITGARPVNDNSRKRKMNEERTDGFKAPHPRAFGVSAEDLQPPAKRTREEEDEHGRSVQHDASKDNVTAFVSNLAFQMSEDRVKEFFDKCGEVVEVRLVKNFKGMSKGYGYVEFTDANEVLLALKLDRQPIDGRPVFVSRCEDRNSGSKTHQFKYATSLEKNKLFIKNLPFTCSVEALEKIFGEHGKLKEARLVTYRSGAPKGLAYVEYETEEEASQAVLKTDGLEIGDHKIEVAISNPPQRKQPLNSLVPSLGGGKIETETRGRARTQVALVPRAVKRPGAAPSKPSATAASNPAQKSGDATTTEKMSNEDFRKMLLK